MATRAAIRYAKALIGFAKDKDSATEVNDDMKAVVKVFTQTDELKVFLQNPVVKSEVKKASLKEIFPKLHSISEGLIDILIENKRIDILNDVAEKYIILYDQLKGKEVAVVTTAVPLNGTLEKKILSKVKELTGNDVSIENIIDESIIGGFILRVGDLQYNASIANKLGNLKRTFSN